MQPHAHIVGSLLRPEPLQKTHQRFSDGNATYDELASVEDAAVDDNIAVQDGFAVITDGEARRSFFQSSLLADVEGVLPVKAGSGGVIVEAAMGNNYLNEQEIDTNTEATGYDLSALVDRLQRRQDEPLALREYRYAQKRTDAAVKITFPNPKPAVGQPLSSSGASLSR